MRLKNCKRSKYLAWAIWSLLSNNPLNKLSYIILLVLESLLIWIYSLTLMYKIHYQNLINQYEATSNLSENIEYSIQTASLDSMNIQNMTQTPINITQEQFLESYWQQAGISYQFIGKYYVTVMGTQTSNYNNLWISFSASIFGINILLISSILIIAATIKSHENLQNKNMLKGIICTIFVLYQSVLQMPLFDILLKAILTIPSIQQASALEVILKYFLSLSSLALYFVILLFIVRLFNLNLPNNQIPWGYPISKIIITECQGDSQSNQKVLGQLLDLSISHIEKCDDQYCVCSEIENFFDLMRLKNFSDNSEVVPLTFEERKKFKKIIDEQGLIGSISNITDLFNGTQSNQNHNQQNIHLFNDQRIIQKNMELIEGQQNNTQKLKLKRQENFNQSQKSLGSRNQLQQEIKFDDINGDRDSKFYSYLSNRQMMRKDENSSNNNKRQTKASIYQQNSNINNPQIFKINADEIQERYIREIIYLFFLSVKNKYYLLQEVEIVAQENRDKQDQISNNQIANLKGEYFIAINHLHRDFQDTIENLCIHMVQFWKEIDKTILDLEMVSKLSSNISISIKQTYEIFQKIEDIQLLKDYQIYFQFAIIQLHIFNDSYNYELYVNKMKSILDANKMIEKNSAPDVNSEYSNYMIIDVNGNQFGNILQINQNLRQLLGWQHTNSEKIKIDKNKYKEKSRPYEEENIIETYFGRVEELMPSLIKQKHSLFMQRYNKTGQSLILNQKTIQFIKKRNQYVIPVEMFVKFYYSVDYKYVFLAMYKPIYQMTPFLNQVKYNTNQLMFLITDNDQGSIYEYSESCIEQLNLKSDFEIQEIKKTVSDILEDFNFKNFKATRRQRYLEGQIYESEHTLNIDAFEEIALWAGDYDISRNLDKAIKDQLNLNHNLLNNEYLFEPSIKVKVRVFEERYCGGLLDVNIFCIQIINDANQDYSVIQKQLAILFDSKIHTLGKGANIEQIVEDEHENEESQLDQQSMSSSVASSTASSQIQLRTAFIIEQRTTPRTVKIMLQLIAILYLIMIVISSINLGITIARQKESEQDMNIVQLNTDRQNQVAKMTLYSRSMLNIANGIIGDTSKLLSHRFDLFQSRQTYFIEELSSTQSEIYNSNFQQSAQLKNLYDEDIMQISFLNLKNQVYSQNESIDLAFNLLLARLSEFNVMNRTTLMGNIPLISFNETLGSSPNYVPTIAEETIYFILQNGIQSYTQISSELVDQYVKDSEWHANSNISSTQILTIVSCLTIICIGLIFGPMFSRAEIRKLKALSFFLKLKRELMSQLIQNCEYCLNMQDQKRNEQIQLDYEDILGVKIRNQQIEQLRQARDQRKNLFNQSRTRSVNMKNSTMNQSEKSSTMFLSQYLGGDSLASIQSDFQFQRPNVVVNEPQTPAVRSSAQPPSKFSQIQNPSANHLSVSVDGKNQYSNPAPEIRLNGNGIYNNGQQHNFQRNLQIINDEFELTWKEKEKNLNSSPGKKSNQSGQSSKVGQNNHYTQVNVQKIIEKRSQRSDQGENDVESSGQIISDREQRDKGNIEQEEDLKQQKEQQEFDQKLKIIKQKTKRIKIRLTLISLLILIILSGYFIISYFLALTTFNTAAEVNSTLQTIFQRSSCFDTTLNFFREIVIRMELIQYEGVSGYSSGVDYLLEQCYAQEDRYSQLRRDRPSYLQDSFSVIDQIESNSFCDYVYQNSTQINCIDTNQLCKEALNGIFLQGFSVALNYMYNWLFKNHLQLQTLIANKDKASLTNIIKDPTLTEIIDVITVLLDPAFKLIQDSARESAVLYIESRLRNFLVAFICFVSLLTLGMLVLVFWGLKKLRQTMWNTNIMLKVIPYEAMEKEERNKIIQFFKY